MLLRHKGTFSVSSSLFSLTSIYFLGFLRTPGPAVTSWLSDGRAHPQKISHNHFRPRWQQKDGFLKCQFDHSQTIDNEGDVAKFIPHLLQKKFLPLLKSWCQGRWPEDHVANLVKHCCLTNHKITRDSRLGFGWETNKEDFKKKEGFGI